jgi:16S rRNA (adenine1518-N6/adenine1519-N6)-dimethyltransferase
MKASRARVPRKKPRLGQHFLTDTAAAIRIVEALGDVSQSTVLEIGPGGGVLTGLLIKRARRVIAIELDRVLAAQLRMRYSLAPNIEIIEGDILAIDFDSLFGPKPGSTRPGMPHIPEPVRVLGNLPYFITSDILLRLFQYRKYFESFVLMLQKEVADRLAARPGNSDYGLLSATAQLGVEESQFIDFLKLSFAQKRKTLWNNLKPRYRPDELKTAMQKAKIDPSVRAEALSLSASASLFRELTNRDGHLR